MDDRSYITHQPIQTFKGSNRPLVGPIYQTVKFTTDTMADLADVFNNNEGRYVYSRVSNPTVRQLEVMLAKLQGCDDAICTASGMGAISSVMIALLEQNDHVVMFYESYKPSRILFRNILNKFGIKLSLLSINEVDKLEETVKEHKTTMIFFESPTNPMTRVIDIEQIIKVCKKHQVTTVMDNTFAGFHNHKQFDIDVYIHSLTKFANGHGDSLGGAIIGTKSLIRKIQNVFIELGACMDPNTAFLISRGMKTYFLRYDKQCENSLIVAQWLEKQPGIKRVYYPGLASHPDHELAKKQLQDMGSVIAVDLDCPHSKYNTFIDSLQVFQLSGSLGSTESLIAPTELFYGNDLTAEEKTAALITNTGVRLSIGVEHPDDLIADLDQALKAITKRS